MKSNSEIEVLSSGLGAKVAEASPEVLSRSEPAI